MQIEKSNQVSTNLRVKNLDQKEVLYDLSAKINKNYFLTAIAVGLVEPKNPETLATICSLSSLNCVRIVTQSPDIEPKTKAVLASVHLVFSMYCLFQTKFFCKIFTNT